MYRYEDGVFVYDMNGQEKSNSLTFPMSLSQVSLAIDKSGVYIGIGNRQIPFEKNGMVLWVEYS